MASDYEIEVAILVLDMLGDKVRAVHLSKKPFDTSTAIFMIKAWTKVGMLLRGDGFHKATWPIYVMERDPSPTKETRSKILLTALDALEVKLRKDPKSASDLIDRAKQAMIDFVWEYRILLKSRGDDGKSKREFAAFLDKWRSTSAEDAKKAVTVGLEAGK